MTAQQIQSILKDKEKASSEAVSDSLLTLDEYIEREETATVKHEFHNGKLTEKVGVLPTHAQISGNFGTFLNLCLFKKNRKLHCLQQRCTYIYT